MHHQHHVTTSSPTDSLEVARNSRNGLILFSAYSLLYVTFMFINAFAPQLMETIVFAGINLAVVYGLGLIVAAFVLALVYAWLCKSPVYPEADA